MAAQTAAFHVRDLTQDLIDSFKRSTPEGFDWSLEREVQTDKDRVKLVSCTECGRPLVVSTFYVQAWAKCSGCKSGSSGESRASVAVPQPGRTDPAKAVNLKDCLLNPTFASVRCPVHPDDDEHVMELKMVSHSDAYGPSEFAGYRNGQPDYRQLGPGETVLHQCLRCKATVTYSTTAQMQFVRQNEVRGDKHVNGVAAFLGSREEVA